MMNKSQIKSIITLKLDSYKNYNDEPGKNLVLQQPSDFGNIQDLQIMVIHLS